jgi:adenosylhomocysteine nucleosidase
MIGIMSAMPEEIAGLVAEMGSPTWTVRAGMRTYHRGFLWGQPAILVFSRWGKVAAATTATYLIEHFGVDPILFTGVAGGIDPSLHVGDVVIASKLYQHDMDARPLFAKHEIPLLGVDGFETDLQSRRATRAAAERFLDEDLHTQVSPDTLREFHISRPRVVVGEIASGDRFVAQGSAVRRLQEELPGIACVEMEGAAVAQVCHEYGVPLAVLRTISDAADESASSAFTRFVQCVASAYSHGILKQLLAPQDLSPLVVNKSVPYSAWRTLSRVWVKTITEDD